MSEAQGKASPYTVSASTGGMGGTLGLVSVQLGRREF